MYADALDPSDAPVPRHEYHSEGEDEDAELLAAGSSRRALQSEDVRIDWTDGDRKSEKGGWTVLLVNEPLCRAWDYAYVLERCTARGMVRGRKGDEPEGRVYARIGTLAPGLAVVLLDRRVRAADAQPLATGLLGRMREQAGSDGAVEMILLDTYLPQTYVQLGAPRRWPTPPVRYLRTGHARGLHKEIAEGKGAEGEQARSKTRLEPLESPNFVAGFSAALLGAALRMSTPVPSTLLLLPAPSHPSGAAQALALLPSEAATALRNAIQSIARTGHRAEWDDEARTDGLGGGRRAPAGGEIGEGGMYI